MSHHGYIAFVLGAVFVTILNVGLMYLVRKRRDNGTDAAVYNLKSD